MKYDFAKLRADLFVVMQYLIPQHLLSRLVGYLASTRIGFIKDFLIRQFIAAFNVDMAEAEESDPLRYPHFNAFFTRALRTGVRPVDPDADAIVSPADGVISQLGCLDNGRLLQAKSFWYTTTELLGAEDKRFEGGSFATIYLSPRDYHRVHMPVSGCLTAMRYIPGRLFSVNATTTAGVPRLFARNERLVCLFETPQGPLAMVLVGAMIVAGIETVWTGPITPAGHHPLLIDYGYPEAQRRLEKGAEMGRFQLGSTVILLFPHGRGNWDEQLDAGSPLRMGQRIGSLSD